jgi:uncharacterized protein
MNLPGTLLLSGVVGSQAYGLATPDSDVDRLGVYAAPTREFHGLTSPLESVVFKAPEPDATYHEAAKMCRLMMNSNPAVMELLWLPADLYEARTELGLALIDIRQSFPSKDRVRRAYLGYATTQFDKLLKRGDGTFSADLRKRTAKHARHLLRLLHQGFGLYSTGRLQVQVKDPALYHSFGEAVLLNPKYASKELAFYEQKFDETPSALPERPDVEVIETWLLGVREAYL